MTNKKIRQQIIRTAIAAQAENQYVDINPILPTVLIHRDENDEYFFQEQEASNLLDEAQTACNKFSVTLKEWLLYAAQGW